MNYMYFSFALNDKFIDAIQIWNTKLEVFCVDSRAKKIICCKSIVVIFIHIKFIVTWNKTFLSRSVVLQIAQL